MDVEEEGVLVTLWGYPRGLLASSGAVLGLWEGPWGPFVFLLRGSGAFFGYLGVC